MTLQTVLDEIRTRPGKGDVIPIINPATEEQITEFTDCGEEGVDDAVARAKASFESGVWSQLPGRQRAKIMWRIADLIDEHADEFAQLDSLNTGMPLMQAQLQMSTCSEFFRYYAGWCSKLNGVAYDVKTDGIATDTFVSMHAYTLKEPYSVVGLIFPWNGPIFNACAKLAPALAAGCSMVVKPAEETPLSALLLDRLIHEAGVPEGVVNLLTGYGYTAGAAITRHPDVEKVAFTGSTEVGKEIVRASAGNLKKVTLELGGKSPVLIFDDADMSKCILMAALGIFVHSGQGCVCGSRIFAQRGVYDQVVEGIAAMANTFKLGGPDEEGCVSGPLISQKQLNRVMGFIDEGKSEGVDVVTGGHRLDRKGYFVHPTVLTNVDPGMRLYREEIFGPVVSILPFDDEDEAVALANDTTYGLAATAWTENVGRAHRIVKRLQAGSVQVNCQLVFDHDVPFGGYKQSGWGHEFGREGIEIYLKTKSVWAQL
ncbi:betaine-aldehyde dehydrogenase [Mycobacterium intermedium]|uniref:Putative succinate-semialdehyde dehydrogenase [NADP(+)] 2 n=1 Tax=Mycobacterium intermedium TaxID=28445 RepID=A0A1E3S6D0_MYCIE|nr:aldehyde dehydrogenase family protein [Mycobacterium intermedium]MCV6967942.1 aldehyde dehydrogenase family protein [Mycobacterium intermedium]ODQ97716.1 betaine-aldehyde dehydrogenase [Mycobacterium intermedium]OPE46387.1 betaine-aldehyde dehydrogenase [Mycobacterium intermedium]ORB09435.1 betaine-aldehyde dehydrogenase [Mycobacterium intermedium]